MGNILEPLNLNPLFLKLGRFIWKVCERHIHTWYSWEEKWRTASSFTYLSPLLVFVPMNTRNKERGSFWGLPRVLHGELIGTLKNDTRTSFLLYIERKLVEKGTIEGLRGVGDSGVEPYTSIIVRLYSYSTFIVLRWVSEIRINVLFSRRCHGVYLDFS